MTNKNYASLSRIPAELNKRMVVIKPTWLSEDHAVKTWEEAIRHLIKNFWGAGADCSFVLEAKALLDGHVYDAAVTITPDGRFGVRLI